MDSCKTIYEKMQSLAVFRTLLEDEVVKAFLEALSATDEEKVSAYAEFVSLLYRHSVNWSEYLFLQVQQNENIYVKKRLHNEPIDELLQQATEQELAILQEASRMQPASFSQKPGLPQYHITTIDFPAEYETGIVEAHKRGFGMFARYYAFTVHRGELVPVKNPDTIAMEDLFGYDAERQEVVANTRALIARDHAANALLYGDAGTGKSSTVKAVVNAFKDQGLRLIEVRKDQLQDIPVIIDTIADNPLSFILFIDDLSFSQNDDNFGALKAILEGGIAAKTSNIAVYATSNRRHLVKESFSDRNGDDLHFNDTLEEVASLSARFGLTITFSKPDKELYLEIVHDLVKLYGLKDVKDIDVKAEAYAIRRGGRAPRIAKQFVEHLKIQMENE